MKIKNLLTLCVASLLLFSCSESETPTESRSIVAGQVINRSESDPTVMLWNMLDPFCDESLTVKLSEDGSFHMESQNVNMFNDRNIRYNNFISFFSAPGDSIYVVIDAAKLKAKALDAVVFSGDRAEENNEFYLYSKVSSSDCYKSLEMDIEPAEMIVQLNERLDMFQNSLDTLEKQQKAPMSDNLREFLRKDLLYGLANYIQGYKSDDRSVQLELFSDPFFGITDSLNLNACMFPYHLTVYLGSKLNLDEDYLAAKQKRDDLAIMHSAIDVIKREPASINRDVMAWQYLAYHIESNPEYYEQMPEMQTIFTSSLLNEKFAELVRKYSAKEEFPVTPLTGIRYMEKDGTVTKLPEGDIFAHLTKKHPNKVLYIDVYATWCGPCLEEFEHGPALYKAMEERDVVFVYLCLSSDLKEWPKTVAKYNLTAKENYRFNMDANDIFRSVYNVSGFPTYMLVGRDGEIITRGVERPSELKKLSQQIDELLTK